MARNKHKRNGRVVISNPSVITHHHKKDAAEKYNIPQVQEPDLREIGLPDKINHWKRRNNSNEHRIPYQEWERPRLFKHGQQYCYTITAVKTIPYTNRL